MNFLYFLIKNLDFFDISKNLLREKYPRKLTVIPSGMLLTIHSRYGLQCCVVHIDMDYTIWTTRYSHSQQVHLSRLTDWLENYICLG